MSLGAKIRDLRTALDMEQQELAEKLDVSPSVVSDWEAGHMHPRLDRMKQLARALKVDVRELIEEIVA